MKKILKNHFPSGVAGLVLALSLVGCTMEDELTVKDDELLNPSDSGVDFFDDGEEAEAIEAEGQVVSGDEAEEFRSEASVEYASCGQAGPNRTNRVTTNAAYPSGAKQRSGSSTACVPIGVLQPTDDALYYCWTAAGSYTWTYLKNTRTGYRGWVRDDLLRDNGSPNSCW